MRKIFIHLGFLFIIAGMSIICIDKVNASINRYYFDVEKSKEIVEEVKNDYLTFRSSALTIKNKVEDVSKSLSVFLDSFEEENIKIIEKINDVEKNIESINILKSRLEVNCSYDINNINMSNNCESFNLNYKNMINSYNDMLAQYNKVLKKYSEYKNIEYNEYISKLSY